MGNNQPYKSNDPRNGNTCTGDQGGYDKQDTDGSVGIDSQMAGFLLSQTQGIEWCYKKVGDQQADDGQCDHRSYHHSIRSVK